MSLCASCSRRVRGFFHIITLILLGLQVNSDERFCLVQPVGYRLGNRLHFVTISRANFQLMTSTPSRDMIFHQKAPHPNYLTAPWPTSLDLPHDTAWNTFKVSSARWLRPYHTALVSGNAVPDPDDELVSFVSHLVDTEKLFTPEAEFSCDPSAPNLTYPRLLPPPARMPRGLLPFPEWPPLLHRNELLFHAVVPCCKNVCWLLSSSYLYVIRWFDDEWVRGGWHAPSNNPANEGSHNRHVKFTPPWRWKTHRDNTVKSVPRS